MDQFTWGIEFETNLLLYNKKGIDREVIWKKEKTQLTTEFWDVKLGHLPFDDGYTKKYFYVLGYPSEDVGDVFNIESQLGTFQGIKSLSDAIENISLLESTLQSIVQTKHLKINRLFPIYEYKMIREENKNDAEYKDKLFLDFNKNRPGIYPGIEPGTFGGYHNDLKDESISGKPQVTISFPMRFIPKLYELLFEYSARFYPEFEMPLKNTEMIMKQFDSIILLPNKERQEVRGFFLYLLHYFICYQYYLELVAQYRKEGKTIQYFKAIFLCKPRTNPAILFDFFQTHIQDSIMTLLDQFPYQPLQFSQERTKPNRSCRLLKPRTPTPLRVGEPYLGDERSLPSHS